MRKIKYLRAYDGRYYGWDNSISLYDSNGSKVDGVSVNRDFSSWDILEILADEGYIDVERDEWGEIVETGDVVWSNLYVFERARSLKSVLKLIKEAEKIAPKWMEQKERG